MILDSIQHSFCKRCCHVLPWTLQMPSILPSFNLPWFFSCSFWDDLSFRFYVEVSCTCLKFRIHPCLWQNSYALHSLTNTVWSQDRALFCFSLDYHSSLTASHKCSLSLQHRHTSSVQVLLTNFLGLPWDVSCRNLCLTSSPWIKLWAHSSRL